MIFSLLIVALATAATGENAPGITAAIQDGSIVISPPPGHHFNLKAPAETSAYICDDAKTYCVKRTVRVDEQAKMFSKSTVPTTPPSSPGAAIGKRQAKHFGFIYNDAARAMAEAQKTGKPLLIDFFAIWCPPCNQLDETVFNKSEYKNLAKQFVTIKLDVDDEASWELKSRYKVTGYPTVVFAKPDGTEIHRIIGYVQPKAFFRAMAATAHGEKPVTLAASTPLPDPDKDDPEKIISMSKELLNSGLPDDVDMQATDLWQLIGEAEKKRGNEAASKAAYAEAVTLYREKLKTAGGAFNRGFNLEMAYCLGKTGDVAGAEAVYKGLEKHYPREFTFYYAHGRMLQGLKRSAEALPLAEKAMAYGYGDNRLRAALLNAQLLGELHKNTEARGVVERTLASTKTPSDPDNRTHRYLKQLRELKEKLADN